ncbi:MAG TPA: tRNA threonylcarbamoyladenosine dehydratase [Enhygromyxa sp.]|nr:tRNA threonylcarbamoyladenosine dehydratase [Enhygromyxa sp.]
MTANPPRLPWLSPEPTEPSSGLLSLRRETPAEPDEPEQPDDEQDYRLHRRFDRIGRLVGDQAMRKLLNSHVMVIGLGGVGSWAAEALARSGVGRLSLVDFDLVCVTNANRQLHAMRGTTGKPKVTVMAERLRAIHPTCEVEPIRCFYEADTSEDLLAREPDLIIDAIDNLTAKAHLIATCRARGLPLIVSGGASGRLDPTQIRVGDLSEVEGDPFLRSLRKILRRRHQFPTERGWQLPTVHSLEPPADPVELAYDDGQGFRCVCPQGDNGKHTCDARNLIYGTASFVTGAFGFACSSQAISKLIA